MSRGGSSRFFLNRLRAYGLITLVGVVAVILILPFTPAQLGLAFHLGCQVGSVVESEVLWTPWLVVDSPFGGTADGVANVTNPAGNMVSSGPVVADNGSAVAEFSLNNWTVRTQSQGWILGPGADQACSGAYFVSLDRIPVRPPTSSSTNFLINVSLLGEGNTSDASQPHAITAGGHSSVVFGVNFTNNYNFIDTCQGSGITEKVTVSEEAVGVPVSIPGTGGIIAVEVSVQAFYVYQYPGAPGGVWYRMFAPWGALSFEWAHCP
jgi:hypothetical protein